MSIVKSKSARCFLCGAKRGDDLYVDWRGVSGSICLCPDCAKQLALHLLKDSLVLDCRQGRIDDFQVATRVMYVTELISRFRFP